MLFPEFIMNRKSWSDLQSRRSLIHRRKRQARKLHLDRLEQLKKAKGPLRPLEVTPMPKPKETTVPNAQPKDGFLRRAAKRIVGS